MATFRLTTPGGATYEMDAPDEGAAVAALGKLIGAPAPKPSAVPGRRNLFDDIPIPSSANSSSKPARNLFDDIPLSASSTPKEDPFAKYVAPPAPPQDMGDNPFAKYAPQQAGSAVRARFIGHG